MAVPLLLSAVCTFQILMVIFCAVFVLLAQCCGCFAKHKKEDVNEYGPVSPPSQRMATSTTTDVPNSLWTKVDQPNARQEEVVDKKEADDNKRQKKREYVSGKNPEYGTLKHLDKDIFTKKTLDEPHVKPSDVSQTASRKSII